MKSSLVSCSIVLRAALIGAALLGVACSDDADPDASGTPQTADPGPDGGAQTPGPDAAGDPQTAGPEFLDTASYADVVTIAPAFPFGVTHKHAVTGGVLGARWGNHGGPVITTQDFSAPASPLAVSRLTLPADATGDATRAELTSVLPSDLPETRFWAADGFVDLPFGSLSMVSYSTSAAPYAGELFFYAKDYDRVVSRVHVNGYYSGVGLLDGSTRRLVYSGLSGLTSDPSVTSESALWASNVCGDSLTPAGECAESVKLFGWDGNSGPVTADADGNVFVAASLTGGAHTDAIYGLAKSQAFSSAGVQKGTLAELDHGGTSSIAAVTKPGSGKGWVVAKGYDGEASANVFARAYHAGDADLVADGDVIPSAIAAAAPDASTSVFADPEGHLWIGVESPSASWLLELEAKP